MRTCLDELYGDQIDRVVLYGSRTRGDAHEDSDYDVAVFLKSVPDRWKELDRLADLRTDLLNETDAFFDIRPFLASAYQERTPLMREIRRYGLELSVPHNPIYPVGTTSCLCQRDLAFLPQID
jgi:predicted nucleotidyltransferase